MQGDNSITHGTLGNVSKIKVKIFQDRKKTIGRIVVNGKRRFIHGYN